MAPPSPGACCPSPRRDELRAETVELNALLQDLRDVLSHTLGSPVAVAVEIAADLPPVLADKGQLETALVNLATNARDAMPEGGTLRFAAPRRSSCGSAMYIQPTCGQASTRSAWPSRTPGWG